MNDGELITLVREQRTKVPMTTPVDEIIGRGRAVRARRRIPGVAAVTAVAGGAVLAVTTLLPAGQPAGAQLAAWTVTKHAGGTIYVTFRELRDAAGLQARLRADGVPASVTFGGKPNPSCREYPGRWDLTKAGVQEVSGNGHVFAIHPAALPRGAGVQFTGRILYGYAIPGHPVTIYLGPGNPAKPSVPGTRPTWGMAIGAGLVQASPQCTGS